MRAKVQRVQNLKILKPVEAMISWTQCSWFLHPVGCKIHVGGIALVCIWRETAIVWFVCPVSTPCAVVVNFKSFQVAYPFWLKLLIKYLCYCLILLVLLLQWAGCCAKLVCVKEIR